MTPKSVVLSLSSAAAMPLFVEEFWLTFGTAGADMREETERLPQAPFYFSPFLVLKKVF